MGQIHMRFPGGKTKAVTLSYDDGVRQDVRLSGILQNHGMKGTFNINSSLMGDKNDGKMTAEDIKTHILGAGHEIAVHGDYHVAPGSVRPVTGLIDALDCRRKLEEMFSMIIRGMAYPNCGITRFTGGSDYETTRAYLKNIDIAYARTLAGDNDSFMLPEDWYRWMPTAHHNNKNLFDWVREFTQLDVDGLYRDSRYPRLFYLWGHSYEFDSNDNWDLIERFCSEIGGKEDTWYATNIEIYDYVSAFRALIFSADGGLVYNPTLFELFFDTGDGFVSVPSGKTVKL